MGAFGSLSMGQMYVETLGVSQRMSDAFTLKVVDGQLVTKEERSFVESMLMAGSPGQELQSSSFGDDTSLGLDAQKTVKINQLSFNEHGKRKEDVHEAQALGHPGLHSAVHEAEATLHHHHVQATVQAERQHERRQSCRQRLAVPCCPAAVV